MWDETKLSGRLPAEDGRDAHSDSRDGTSNYLGKEGNIEHPQWLDRKYPTEDPSPEFLKNMRDRLRSRIREKRVQETTTNAESASLPLAQAANLVVAEKHVANARQFVRRMSETVTADPVDFHRYLVYFFSAAETALEQLVGTVESTASAAVTTWRTELMVSRQGLAWWGGSMPSYDGTAAGGLADQQLFSGWICDKLGVLYRGIVLLNTDGRLFWEPSMGGPGQWRCYEQRVNVFSSPLWLGRGPWEMEILPVFYGGAVCRTCAASTPTYTPGDAIEVCQELAGALQGAVSRYDG
jgi:hypothetical protein